MKTSSRRMSCRDLARCFAIAATALFSTNAVATIEEITVYGDPLDQGTSYDVLYIYFQVIGDPGDGSWDSEIDDLDAYEDFLECRDYVAAPKVDQCKAVYATQGTILCGTAVGLTVGGIVRFLKLADVADAFGASGLAAALSCTNLNQEAFEWCEGPFRNKVIEVCMGQD